MRHSAAISATKCHKFSDGPANQSGKVLQLLCPISFAPTATIRDESDSFRITSTRCWSFAFVGAESPQLDAAIGNNVSPSPVDNSSFNAADFLRFDPARTLATNW
jgi:hypothetical protein